MPAKLFNTIVLKGDPRYEERVAAAEVKPGHLLEIDSAGKVIKHATGAGPHGYIFAIEDDLQGKTIDDAYAIGDVVRMVHCKPGDKIYARIAAAHADTVIGGRAKSAGDGTVAATAVAADPTVGYFEEVVNPDGVNEAFVQIVIA